MANKKIVRFFTIALSVMLILGGVILNLVGEDGYAYGAAGNAEIRNINLGFTGVDKPTSTSSNATAWEGDKVYLGNRLWKVLDNQYATDYTSNCAALLTDQTIGTRGYNRYTVITWPQCELRTYLNDTWQQSTFSKSEMNAIEDTYTDNAEDKIFCLGIYEYNRSSYGFASTASRCLARRWWLRTRNPSNNHQSFSVYDGNLSGADVNFGLDVFPAMNLNLSKVCFVQTNGGSKGDFARTADGSSNKVWNVTLLGGESFEASVSPEALSAGETLEIDVTSLGTPAENVEYTQISAMLVDSNGTVCYYGKIGDVKTGKISLNIPDSLSSGKYKLYTFAEDVNTNDSASATDYASNMVKKEIVVGAKHEVTFDANGGEGTMNPINPVVGYAYTMPECTFTAPSKMQFKTWAIGSADSETTVNVGETHVFNSAEKVYAVWEEIPVYTISLSKDSKDFGTLIKDYEQTPDEETFTITNTGNKNITLSKNDLENFAVSEFSKSEIAPGEAATFTVKPNQGLNVGNYEETITITGDHDIEATVTVSLTVDPRTYESNVSNKGSWTQNSGEPLTITTEKAIDSTTTVKIDGVEISKEDYKGEEGSYEITFNEEFLKSLSTGTHTAIITWDDGSTEVAFNVNSPVEEPNTGNTSKTEDQAKDKTKTQTTEKSNKSSEKSPETGDNTLMNLYLIMLLASMSTMTLLHFRNKEV